MSRIAYRHGDVVILPLESNEAEQVLNKNTKPVRYPAEGKRTMDATLALGEVTGHSHVVDNVLAVQDEIGTNWNDRDWTASLANALGIAGGVATRQNWGQEPTVVPTAAQLPADAKVVEIGEGGGTLTHQEHATIKLPQGTYMVFQQREFWGGEPRRVFD